MRNLQQFIRTGDPDSVWTVWTCCAMCLAHLATLCHSVGQADPSLSKSMNHLYDLTMDQLGNLSLGVRTEHHSNFDLLIGLSWKTALDTVNARLRLCSDPESRSLRHWKVIIERAYDEFRANLPGSEPTTFASQVFATDGRSGGSKFPNLMVAEERERYGL